MATTDKVKPVGTKNAWSWHNKENHFAIHHDVAGGEAAEALLIIRAADLSQDIHVDKLIVSIENSLGDGKTITVTCGNGTSTITATVTGVEETSGSSVTNNFDFDVSAQDLTVGLTSTAGTTAGCATILVIYHDVTIT